MAMLTPLRLLRSRFASAVTVRPRWIRATFTRVVKLTCVGGRFLLAVVIISCSQIRQCEQNSKKKVSNLQNTAQRLSKLRAKLGLNQQQLADQLGISRNYVSMLEQGREPSKSIVLLIEKLESDAAGDQTSVREESHAMAETPQRMMRLARMQKGVSFADLAKMTRYNAGVLQAVEEGNGKASEKMIEEIARALGLRKSALMAGQVSESNGLTGTYGARPDVESHGAGTPRYIPLISMAQAGALDCNAFDDGAYQYEGTLAFDVKDNKAFGVTIIGESMQPQFGPGDVAIVYPQSTPRSGDHVIARLAETIGDQVLFKIYTPKGRDALILSSYNPAFQPVEVSREDITWIYPVVSVMKNLRGK